MADLDQKIIKAVKDAVDSKINGKIDAMKIQLTDNNHTNTLMIEDQNVRLKRIEESTKEMLEIFNETSSLFRFMTKAAKFLIPILTAITIIWAFVKGTK